MKTRRLRACGGDGGESNPPSRKRSAGICYRLVRRLISRLVSPPPAKNRVGQPKGLRPRLSALSEPHSDFVAPAPHPRRQMRADVAAVRRLVRTRARQLLCLPPVLRGVTAPRPAIPQGHPLSNPRVPIQTLYTLAHVPLTLGRQQNNATLSSFFGLSRWVGTALFQKGIKRQRPAIPPTRPVGFGLVGHLQTPDKEPRFLVFS